MVHGQPKRGQLAPPAAQQDFSLTLDIDLGTLEQNVPAPPLWSIKTAFSFFAPPFLRTLPTVVEWNQTQVFRMKPRKSPCVATVLKLSSLVGVSLHTLTLNAVQT